MRREPHGAARPPIFGVYPGALLALADHATAHADADAVAGSAGTAGPAGAVELGLFVGASRFVGNGTVADGAARITVQAGVTGVVTVFISVAGEVHGVVEAVLADDAELLVLGPAGTVPLTAFLAPFGARMAETATVPTLDPETARRWLSGLALEVRRRGSDGAAR